MKRWVKLLRGLRQEDGSSMVEFAIIIVVLLLIVLGTIEFGLIWYTKYVMACATREGARFGTIYQTVPGTTNRLAPCNFGSYTPPGKTIEEVVRAYLRTSLPQSVADQCTIVPPTGTCYSAGTSGQDLRVIVTTNNPWNLLGGFLPFMRNMHFQAETIMKCE